MSRDQGQDVSQKVNRVLNVILLALLLIIIRIWHLSVVQYEERLEESRRPQKKTIIEPSKRATIRDRFNIPLAINQIHYQAAFLYSELKSIPSVRYEIDENGKKVRKFVRKEYIKKLSSLIAEELHLDPERVEDLIYSKAALYYSIPYILKEDISEKEYYRLKMLEKDWLGIHVQQLTRRHYPLNKVAGDIIGYMGAINREEYERILGEIQQLNGYFSELQNGDDPPIPFGIRSPEQAYDRLSNLEEMAYTIHDHVGKAGIESRFEQDLRGFQGKRMFYSDAKGNFLAELPEGRTPLPGKRLLLTISSELQEYAEQLLAQNEGLRETKISGPDAYKQLTLHPREPWIKGGAIVAMNPNTGEVYALASYPRIDPNDFILSGNLEQDRQKKSNIQRWFENEPYLAELWNQQRPLEKESYESKTQMWTENAILITWDNYLDLILPPSNRVRISLKRIGNIENAIAVQSAVHEMMRITRAASIYPLINALYSVDPHVSYQNSSIAKIKLDTMPADVYSRVLELKKKIDKYVHDIPLNHDKVLLFDICRMAVRDDLFTQELIQHCGKQDFSSYHDCSTAFANLESVIKPAAKELFKDIVFKDWRQKNEKDFLKQKRQEEKQQHLYQKPYIDYLDYEEGQMFDDFWNMHQWNLMEAFLTGESRDVEDLEDYLSFFKNWHNELLEGAHAALPWRHAYLTLQKHVKEISPLYRENYLKTLRGYNELNRPLLGNYRNLRNAKKLSLEKHLATAFYPAYGFGYGRSHAYRQATTQGSIFKLIPAYEAMVQLYPQNPNRNLTPADLNPLVMVDQIFKKGNTIFVGMTEDGKPIPQLYKGGRIPRSSSNNFGRLDLLKAIETSSNPYFSLVAAEVLEDPNDMVRAAELFGYGRKTGIDLPAEIPGKMPTDLETNKTGLYATAIGQHTLVVTPLQTAVMLSAIANGGKILKPQIVCLKAGKNLDRDPLASTFKGAENGTNENSVDLVDPVVIGQVFMPDIIRRILLEGMHRVVLRTQHESLIGLSRFYKNHPEAISDYVELKNQMVGKTSTAESMERLDLDSDRGTTMYKHVWFGGISFKKDVTNGLINKKVYSDPELVVVVYVKFGGYGKETAPMAAQIVKKWREISAKNTVQ